MAKMIPTTAHPETPQSERAIFDRLRLDPATADWTVLHSLGLARTRIGPYGEIDFVVLIPGKGIVCLEVKGGLVSCRDGVWATVNQKTGETKRLSRSPYLQARAGMFALKEAIQREFGRHHPAAGCPLSYAVVFPSVAGPPRSPGEEPWETIDIEALRSPISQILIRNIDGTRGKLPHTPGSDAAAPDAMKAIRQFLRPDFDRVVSRASTIRQTEDQLVALTESQYNYLDTAELNDRALVMGAAGTGKTLLATEFARREVARDRRVLLLCYNRVLAGWLKQLFQGASLAGVTVGTFHSILRACITSSSYAGEFKEAEADADSHRLFCEVLPFYAELALAEQGPLADTLIIDEAQDLLSSDNMGALNQLVVGGLPGGRWVLFGDFTQQAIYRDAARSGPGGDFRAALDELCPSYVRIVLRVNCRNTRRIGEETALLSGFESLPYRLGRIDGPAVDYRYWRRPDDEPEVLQTVLKQLLDDGVPPQDIVVLAPSVYERSSVPKLQPVNGVRVVDLRDLSGEPGNCIVFSTIHSFKGMESPVVVMCGVTDIKDEHDRSLLYVGMSRARSQLIMVVSDTVRALMPGLIQRRLAMNVES